MFNLQVSFPVEHALVPPSRLVGGILHRVSPTTGAVGRPY